MAGGRDGRPAEARCGGGGDVGTPSSAVNRSSSSAAVKSGAPGDEESEASLNEMA